LNDRGARPRRTFNAPILRSESSTKASSNTASISMAALVNPTNPNADIWSTGLQGAARALGLELNLLRASTQRDIW
jgi:hypothetical protein